MHTVKRILAMFTTTALSQQQRLDILFGAFFIHLVFTVWSSLCGCLPQSFLLYNGLFLLAIIWSLHHRESEEPPFMAMCINLLSVMFDLVNLCLFWPLLSTGSMRFGAAAAVLNLALRPFSALLLYWVTQDRLEGAGGGADGRGGRMVNLPSGFRGFAGGHKKGTGSVRGLYEEIDQSKFSSGASSKDAESLSSTYPSSPPPPRPPPPTSTPPTSTTPTNTPTHSLTRPPKNKGLKF